MSKVITPEAILSFPHLFKPEAFEEGDKPAYSCALVFTPEAQKDPKFKAMKVAALEVAVEKWGDKAKTVIQGQRYPTFRTDVEEKGYPEGSVYINVRSYNKPQIVSIVPDPANDGKPMRITEEMSKELGSAFEIYPGAVVIASVNAVAYERKGNKGVSFWINNMQKRADGERLAGGVPADEEFEADAEAAALLTDLTGEQFEEGDGDNAMTEAEEVALTEPDENPEPEEETPPPAPKTKTKAKAKATKPKGAKAKKEVDLDDLF